MRVMVGLMSALALAACDARFVDLRAAVAVPDGSASGADGGVAPDAGITQDGGSVADGGPPSDGGLATSPDAGAPVRYEGTWEGRVGYRASGGARVSRGQDGRFALELGADFTVSGVPGPVLVLSTRATLGTSIQPGMGDVEVGALRANSGAQTYDLGERFNAAYVWVYCKPFGVEVARAGLTLVMQ